MQPEAQITTELPTRPRAEPIRRRTMILLRWVALGGQISAIVAAWLIGVEFAIVPALCVVGIGVALNLWMTASASRVTQSGAMWQLFFDLIQICALIGLTGGLSNPFAVLVLAPVTIAATALQWRQTVLIGVATMVMFAVRMAGCTAAARNAGLRDAACCTQPFHGDHDRRVLRQLCPARRA